MVDTEVANKAPRDRSLLSSPNSGFPLQRIWMALRSIEPLRLAANRVSGNVRQGGSRVTNVQQSNRSLPSCVEGPEVRGMRGHPRQRKNHDEAGRGCFSPKGHNQSAHAVSQIMTNAVPWPLLKFPTTKVLVKTRLSCVTPLNGHGLPPP